MSHNKSEAAKKWGLWSHLLWYVLANVAQVIVWATATSDQFFWPLYSIVAWGIGLGFHIWAYYRSSTPHPAP